MPNQHGLKRRPPAPVRLEVRQRCKFGCVICRTGFYHYEHILPEFKDASEHNPDHICCLCGSCHDLVSRGVFSKAKVRESYEAISNAAATDVPPPTGPLDFHAGNAELVIGGISYSPAVRRVLTYYDQDLISLHPRMDGGPGAISAIFLDDKGDELLRLEENEWVGNTDGWDIETVGKKLTLRQKARHISLALRLKPPGVIVVERLDMRIGSAHFLATEKSYAVGRYFEEQTIVWMSAITDIQSSSPLGCAIEITDPDELKHRYEAFPRERIGSELRTTDKRFTSASGFGVACMPLGVSIASLCSDFRLGSTIMGSFDLKLMRKAVRKDIQQAHRFLTTVSP